MFTFVSSAIWFHDTFALRAPLADPQLRPIKTARPILTHSRAGVRSFVRGRTPSSNGVMAGASPVGARSRATLIITVVTLGLPLQGGGTRATRGTPLLGFIHG